MTEEYELIPRKMIEELKEELDEVKSGSFAKNVSKSSKNKESSSDVSKKLDILIDIFKSAKEETKHLDQTSKFHQINSRLDDIEGEMKKVSQAIVALAKMIRKKDSQNMNSSTNQNNQSNPNNINQNNQNNQNSNFNSSLSTPNQNQTPQNSSTNSNNNMSPQNSSNNSNNQSSNQNNKGDLPPPPPPIKGLFNKNKKNKKR